MTFTLHITYLLISVIGLSFYHIHVLFCLPKNFRPKWWKFMKLGMYSMLLRAYHQLHQHGRAELMVSRSSVVLFSSRLSAASVLQTRGEVVQWCEYHKVPCIPFSVETTHLLTRSCSSDGIATRLRAGRSDDRGSIPGGGWEFFSSTQCPDWLWVPPGFLSCG
jgi:hypothetical protein